MQQLIKKTSIFSDSRFPSFVRGNPEFDMLRRFIKSYFESLEESGKSNNELLYARENSDVDTVTSQFLDRFYTSLCPELPIDILADKRLLLKHSRELYQKKGTPDSFKYLFKILYNETINIKYPSENILRASDGKWTQTVSIHVSFPNIDEKIVYGLVGHEFTVKNASGLTRNTITQIRKIPGTDVFEISVDKQKNTRFDIGDTFIIDDIIGTILPSTQSVKILKQGRNFKVGQIIKLDVKDGVGTGSLAKITDVTSIGGIKSVKIIKFGSGYNADFNITVFADSSGVTNVTGGDFEGGILPLKETTFGFKEYGVVSKIGSYGDMKDYFLQDYILEDYISTPHAYFTGTTQSSNTYNSSSDYFLEDYILGDYTNVFTENDLDAYAIISVNVGALLTYPGFWANSQGSLNNPLICLQDNHLYQNFSYMIQSSVPINKFSKIVKDVIHPAGMLMFSDLLLENDIDISSNLADDTRMFVDMFINDISEVRENKEIITHVTLANEVSVDDISEKETKFILNSDLFINEESRYVDAEYHVDGYVEGESSKLSKDIFQNKSDDVVVLDSINKNQDSKLVDSIGTADYGVDLIQNRTLADNVTTLSKIDINYSIKLLDNVEVIEANGYFGGDYNISNDYTIVAYGPILNTSKTTSDITNVIDTSKSDSGIKINTTVTTTEQPLKTDREISLSTIATVNDNLIGVTNGITLSDSVTTPEVASYTGPSYVDDTYYVENVDGFVIKKL